MSNEHTKQNWFKRHKILTGIVAVIALFTILVPSSITKPPAYNVAVKATGNANSLTPTTAQAVSMWRQKYGATFNVLSSDITAYNADAKDANYAIVLNDCQKLQTDATSDIKLPAIPDANAAAHFSSSLTLLQQAAQQCATGMQDYYAGNTDQAISQQETSNNEMTGAGTQMMQAANIVKQDTN